MKLQEGDMYKDGEDWKPVPAGLIGLESPYSEVKHGNGKAPVKTKTKAKIIDPADIPTAFEKALRKTGYHLPTVVSAKAHVVPTARTRPPVVITPKAGVETHKCFRFTGTADCIWTGRNGTFRGYGIEVMQVDNKINLCPIGKRGIGNCTIQFPVDVIPDLCRMLDAIWKDSLTKKGK